MRRPRPADDNPVAARRLTLGAGWGIRSLVPGHADRGAVGDLLGRRPASAAGRRLQHPRDASPRAYDLSVARVWRG